MKVAAIIQARMGSTRLPGKVLKKVKGKTLLEYQIERVKRAQTINEIIIATTLNKEDDQIVELCEQLSIQYYRGFEEDVLSRYYEAAMKFNVDVIVRLTSDCPVIDPEVIDQVVSHYVKNQNMYDYVSNTLVRTYPRGMDTEVFSNRVLLRIYKEAKKSNEREHVTSYIYHHPEQFSIGNVVFERDESQYRLTVDTSEDFALIENILQVLYSQKHHFDLKEIINVLQENPDWVKLNSHIKQKESS